MLVDGKIYGISSCIVAPVLYYNMDLFDAAGMPYPPANPDEMWNWDEFVAAAKKLTIKQGNRTVQFGAYGLENASGFPWSGQRREIFNEDYSRCVSRKAATPRKPCGRF